MKQIIAGVVIIWFGIYIIILQKRIADRFNDKDMVFWVVPLVGALIILVGTLFLIDVFELPVHS
jgi:hypothetical protein